MVNFKEEIAEKVKKAIQIDNIDVLSFIEKPKDANMGDFAFPCFRLAKELKKSPQIIAEEINEKIDILDSDIEKMEVVGGYLNFYIKKDILAKEVIKEISKQEEFGNSEIGKGKNIVIDYSHPNIA